MKRIVILSDRMRIAQKIGTDIAQVLWDLVEIVPLTFDLVDTMETIEGDLVLFMLSNRIERVRNKLPTQESILVIRRTIREESFLKILEIPKNTDVLVVNDNYENTLQLVSLLYDLNVDHILPHPYREGDLDTTITVALTPGEVERVPTHIKKVINIGDRCVDVSTMMEMITRLGLTHEELPRRLLDYASHVVNSNEGMQRYYKNAAIRSMQMEQVLSMSDQGILMTLPDGEVVLCNKKLWELLALPAREEQTHLQQLFDPATRAILAQDTLDDVIVQVNRRDFVVKKNRVTYEAGSHQDIFFFRDVTHIRALEQLISGQLKAKGFVAKYRLEDIIYASPSMKKTIESVKIFANTDKTVLLTGESGTGKELLAQSIHNLSPRRMQPFVAINCAAVPASLLESELFGYAKGAFTGASREGKLGLFEQAGSGTLFLDEIGDMPFELQARLLRVLQEKQVMRVGSDRVIDVDVRIVAATNKDLLRAVEAGLFRADLYYRLCALPVLVPPLRDRKEDIIPIFKSFLPPLLPLPPDVEQALLHYRWPGNVRELRNTAEYYELMQQFETCLPAHILQAGTAQPAPSVSENAGGGQGQPVWYSAEHATQRQPPWYTPADMQPTQSPPWHTPAGIQPTQSPPWHTIGNAATTQGQPAQFIQPPTLEQRVLWLIFQHNEAGAGMGRERLVRLLQQQGVTISEYHLRRILKGLEREGFLSCAVGRGGTRVTKLGEFAING